MPLAGQQIHQRCVHPGPLVLGTNPLNSPTPTADRDRQFCYRSLRSGGWGQVISAWLCMSPCSSDCIFAEASLSAFGVQSLRILDRYVMSSFHRTLRNRPPPFIDNASSRSSKNPLGVRCRPRAIDLNNVAIQPFLLIVRTRHIFTLRHRSVGTDRRVVRDTRIFQHIAEFIDSNGIYCLTTF